MVLYRIEADVISVYAVVHQTRDPLIGIGAEIVGHLRLMTTILE